MKNIKPNNGGLTPAEIKEFTLMLVIKRGEILGDVTSMEIEALRKERSDLSNMPIHLADRGTDSFEQEFTLGLMESERTLLIEINDALERIEKGTYGICEGSGKPIPKARLEAIPWARYCVEYASMLEKGLIRDRSDSTEADDDYGDDQDDEPRKPFKRKAV